MAASPRGFDRCGSIEASRHNISVSQSRVSDELHSKVRHTSDTGNRIYG